MFSPSTFTSVINNYLPEPHASLLNGIIFGANLKVVSSFYQDIKAVGLLHIVVLSGTNISILAALTTSFTGFFSKRISCLITMLTIFLFTLFVGPKAPIVRAAVMGMLTYGAIMYGRKTTALYSLFLSAVLILIIKPDWFGGISLRLSYAATVGIIIFGQTSSKNNLWKELKITLAAQIFTAPLIFIYFKQISLISPVSNILVSPTIPPLMVFGFLTVILGKINTYLGLIPAYICYGILSYVIFVIEQLSKLPYIFVQF